jgi:hypothetical protein
MVILTAYSLKRTIYSNIYNIYITQVTLTRTFYANYF